MAEKEIKIGFPEQKWKPWSFSLEKMIPLWRRC